LIFIIKKTKKGKNKMKTYRIEIQSLSYYDVKAKNPEEAKNKVPKSLSMPIEGGIGASVFYEEFDYNNAKVEEH
tara:strand:- start:213 stop:434 length:222 start_codon:yes stop_codon:yes gene_type:complete